MTTVAPVVAPPPGHPRFPLLDSLRAVAAVGVLLGHVGFDTGADHAYWWGPLVANGDTGVTVFFVLSGFLMYRPMVSAQLHGAARPAWRDYARRRLLRIVPAYWLALTVLAIYPGLPGVFSGDWWRYYFFLQTYSDTTTLGGLVVAWSVCVEVTFYLLLPFYAAAVGRLTRGFARDRRVRFELVLLAGMAVASLVFRYVDHEIGPPTLELALPAFLDWFAVGMALALLSAAIQARQREDGPAFRPAAERWIARHPGACWAAAFGLFAVAAAILGKPPQSGWSNVQTVFIKHLLAVVAACLLVLPAVFGDRAGGWPRRVMAWGLLAWLGLISYGIYLWHDGVVTILEKHGIERSFTVLGAATIVGTAAIAAASYYVVERPILRFKVRRPRPQAAPRRDAMPV